MALDRAISRRDRARTSFLERYGNDLITLGILTRAEVSQALRRYTSRLMYQRSLVAGGSRFDLDAGLFNAVD
jgi:hypothetical protein